jgi:acid stress-induced BolA-like protein IbaG/YrbA
MTAENVKTCPHLLGDTVHDAMRVRLCRMCYEALLEALADKEIIRLMIRSTMTVAELQRIARERAEVA